jgi:hypothetical protein
VPIRTRKKETGLQHSRANAVESIHWQAAGIRGCFQHQWRHGGNERGVRDASSAGAANITGDFSPACRVADVDCILQVEGMDQ